QGNVEPADAAMEPVNVNLAGLGGYHWITGVPSFGEPPIIAVNVSHEGKVRGIRGQHLKRAVVVRGIDVEVSAVAFGQRTEELIGYQEFLAGCVYPVRAVFTEENAIATRESLLPLPFNATAVYIIWELSNLPAERIVRSQHVGRCQVVLDADDKLLENGWPESGWLGFYCLARLPDASSHIVVSDHGPVQKIIKRG